MDLRAEIVDEFSLSQKIVRNGVDVVPRFKIYCPDGPHVCFITLPDEPEDRLERFDVVRQFMIWNAATGFLLSSELANPNALFVAAVTRTGTLGAVQAIRRDP